MTLASGGEIKAVREMDEEKLPERERDNLHGRAVSGIVRGVFRATLCAGGKQ